MDARENGSALSEIFQNARRGDGFCGVYGNGVGDFRDVVDGGVGFRRAGLQGDEKLRFIQRED